MNSKTRFSAGLTVAFQYVSSFILSSTDGVTSIKTALVGWYLFLIFDTVNSHLILKIISIENIKCLLKKRNYRM